MKVKRDFFEALCEALEKIVGSLDHDEVMKNVVQSTIKAMGSKACSLRLLDRKRGRLMLGYSSGLSEGYIRKGPILIDESALDREALTGKTVYVENAQTDPRFQYPEKAKAEGIVSLLVAPLTAEGKVVGIIRIYAGEVRRFDDEEMKFLEAMARLSGLALENARLHETLRMDFEHLVADRYRIDEL
ncbi:MAG: GAF domain-containing protein [Desulfobacteraceae bacterium]|nr:GAF domain-containing protein [Desulfobacteraceae bacterium]